MQSSATLEKEMIDQPQLWRLVMQINETSIDVILMCNVRDDSLIYRHIDLDCSTASFLAAFETAIYANQLLLADFNSIDILVSSRTMAAIPGCIRNEPDHAAILNHLFPDKENESSSIIINPVSGTDMSIVMMLNTDLVGFLRRTFNNPAISHPLAPLCAYFAGKNPLGNSRKMLAYFHDSFMDIVVTNYNNQPFVNSFECPDHMDAVYYIMAVHRMLQLDSESDEVFVAGNNDRRTAVANTLREYLPYVMPLIFPAAMHKAGRDAIHAPLPLILTPLCE